MAVPSSKRVHSSSSLAGGSQEFAAERSYLEVHQSLFMVEQSWAQRLATRYLDSGLKGGLAPQRSDLDSKKEKIPMVFAGLIDSAVERDLGIDLDSHLHCQG